MITTFNVRSWGRSCQPSLRRQRSTVSAPMRACIVGSGPAGFYTAYRLLSELPSCTVDIYEALPVPFGLARFGVAPDHPEVKNVMHKFDEVATSPRVKFYGNVRVGHDIQVKHLAAAYDTIVFSHGASLNRRLNINGEDLRGVTSARSFVGWYNGLPEAADLQPNLEDTDTAVVIGQGNVALDIARILLSSVDELKKTDIAEHALEALTRSRISRVNIVGRRGPLQASFTIKEIRELINLPGASFTNTSQDYYKQILAQTSLPRPQKRLMELLSKQGLGDQASKHSWDIQYCLSPREFKGSSHLESIVYEKNELQEIGGQTKANGTGQVVRQDAQLALLSIGYQSEAIVGMEDIGVIFDTNRHIIPNENGRVTTLDGFVPWIYCSGWAKNGPVGVIASTMRDAFETADAMVIDWTNDVLPMRELEITGADLIADLQKTHKVITWDKWKKIQAHEEKQGVEMSPSRPANKITETQKMLDVAFLP